MTVLADPQSCEDFESVVRLPLRNHHVTGSLEVLSPFLAK